MKKESLHNGICICCITNRSPDRKQLLCRQCYIFIHDKLQLSPQYIRRKLSMTLYVDLKHKCSFCESKAVISYNDYDTKKRYYICRSHRDRWLKIGCQLGQLSNFLHVDDE